MQLILYFALVAFILRAAYCLDDKSALCKMWDDIEKGPLKEFQVTCSKSRDCSHFNCSGIAYGNEVEGGIKLHPCENPPSIEFKANVPKLGVHNFQKRIYHNDSINLTKNLKVDLDINRRNKEFVLGLYVHFLNNGSFPYLLMTLPVIRHRSFALDCLPTTTIKENNDKDITKQPVTNGISVTSSPTASGLTAVEGQIDEYSNCSIVNTSCEETEICKQIHKGKQDGICVCRSNYTRDINGKCTHGQPVEASSVPLLLTAILVPIFVILIIVGVVYASIRFRVCQHLRRRLRVQVYEHVLLGEEDEEDLTNPVA